MPVNWSTSILTVANTMPQGDCASLYSSHHSVDFIDSLTEAGGLEASMQHGTHDVIQFISSVEVPAPDDWEFWGGSL